MLKRIPKSDISIRPFKAYKEWSFDQSSSEVSILEADINSTDISDGFPKNSIYGQLRAQFYNDSGDNPFTRTGHKSPRYTATRLTKERFLSGSAKVISIPQIYVGEGIKKGSVILSNDTGIASELAYTDDSFGNLRDYRDQINLSKVDIENSTINFDDLAEYAYSASLLTVLDIGAFDIQTNILTLIYAGSTYELNLISMDINTGIVIVENIPFLPEESQGIKIGNIFYNQGLIVLTKDSALKLQNQWTLDYKSTQTIYENEYLLIVNEDEFNVSQNPSAVVTEGGEYESFIDSSGNTHRVYSKQPVKYIRKKSILENGDILDYRFSGSVGTKKAGFEHYDLSGSIDSTGSFLAPFITTIGLYDDNCDLVAVAKLPQPIKSEPDMPVNFIIRFDT
jgi:hypothetical protein